MTDSLETIWRWLEADRSMGSSELAGEALSKIIEGLDEEHVDSEGLRTEIARGLRETRPEMTLLVNLGHLLENSEDKGTETDALALLIEDLRRLEQRLDRSHERILRSVDESRLSLTAPVLFSRSGTVMRLVEGASPSEEVTVLESHPGDEGIPVANDLDADCDVHFRYDLEALPRFSQSSQLLIGADSYNGKGSVRNKVGTELLARASDELPVVACFPTLKYESAERSGTGPTTDSPESLAGGLRSPQPLFEWVAPEVIDYYATDEGVFDSVEDLRAATQSLRELREESDPSQ